jgi:hypothetical protein
VRPTAFRLALVVSAAAVPFALLAPGAVGHGTVNMLKQSAEHEKLTRGATQCAPKFKMADVPGRCFEDHSEDQLAGTSTEPPPKKLKVVSLKGPLIENLQTITSLKVGTVGAVGSPDIESFFEDTPHCTAGDFLAPPDLPAPATYPRKRADADEALLACHNLLVRHFRRGLDLSNRLVDSSGRIVAKEVELPCDPIDAPLAIRGFRRFTKEIDKWLDTHSHGVVPQAPLLAKLRKFVALSEHFYTGEHHQTAKCRVIGELGKMMHGMQDFYSHGNWADQADARRPLGLDNPPGLNQPGRAPLLDMLVDVPVITPGLVTACFGFLPGGCDGRIDHDDGLGKDLGVITVALRTVLPNLVTTAAPKTPRGMVGQNFNKAVIGAVNESFGAWKDFGNEVIKRYGTARGTQMICAITHDHPVRDCKVKVEEQIDTTVGEPVITGGGFTPSDGGSGTGSGGQPN